MAAGRFFFFSRSTQMETLQCLPAKTVRVSYIYNNIRTCSAHVPQSKHSLQFSKLRLLNRIWKQKEKAADVRLRLALLRVSMAKRDLFPLENVWKWIGTYPKSSHDPVLHKFRILCYVPWLVRSKNVYCNLGQEIKHKLCEPCITRVELRKNRQKRKVRLSIKSTGTNVNWWILLAYSLYMNTGISIRDAI